MSADKGYYSPQLAAVVLNEAARELCVAEEKTERRYYPLMPVRPNQACWLKMCNNFEPLHTYSSDVEPLQGEIGRIRHSADEYTRLVMGDWQGGDTDAPDA